MNDANASDDVLSETLRENAAEVGRMIAADLRSFRSGESEASFYRLVDVANDLLSDGIEEVPDMIAIGLARALIAQPASQPADDLDKSSALVELMRREPDQQGAALLDLIGRIEARNGHWETAREALGAAVSYFQTVQQRHNAAATMQAIAGTLFHQGDFARARDMAIEALAQIDPRKEADLNLQLLLNLAQYCISAEDADRLQAILRTLEPLVAKSRDSYLNSTYLGFLAMLHVLRGEFDQAEPLLRRALRGAQRRRDDSQAQYLSQNLGNVLDAQGKRTGSLVWREKALFYAIKLANPHAISETHHSLALERARRADFPKAVEHLKSAVSAAREAGNPRMIGESLADLAAIRLVSFTGMPLTIKSNDVREELLPRRRRISVPSDDERAEVAGWLNLAIDVFMDLEDATWTLRAASNLLNFRLDTEELDTAHAEQLSIADRLAVYAPEAAARVLRDLAQADMNFRAEASRAAKLYRDAAALSSEVGTTAYAWELAESAAEMDSYDIFHSTTTELFLEAEAVLRKNGDGMGAATVANDRAIVLAKTGEADEAVHLLESVLQVARDRENRVLEEMALRNLGLLSSEHGEPRHAIEFFSSAATLASALGDHAGAAESWHRVALSALELDDCGHAEKALGSARQEASLDGATGARAGVLAVQANMKFRQHQFDDARDLWVQAAELSDPDGRVEYLAFALESLALSGSTQEYISSLQAFVELADSSAHQQEAAQLLWRPSLAWMRHHEPVLASEGFAAALLLSAKAHEAASKTHGTGGTTRAWVPLMRVMTEVYAVLHLDEIAPPDALECARLIEANLAVNTSKRFARELMKSLVTVGERATDDDSESLNK